MCEPIDLAFRIGKQLAQDVTWVDAEHLINAWGGPCAIKGIMSPADGVHAFDHGATAVIAAYNYIKKS